MSDSMSGTCTAPTILPSTRTPPITMGTLVPVSGTSSDAANFAGWDFAELRAMVSPEISWTGSAANATPRPTTRPSRCSRSRRPLSIPDAYTDATRQPVTR